MQKRTASKAPKKRSAVRVPATRKIAGRIVPFNPGIAVDLYSLNSLAHIAQSIGFWDRQLTRMACPACGTTGSLELIREKYGIVVFCVRDRCDFEHEELFFGGS